MLLHFISSLVTRTHMPRHHEHNFQIYASLRPFSLCAFAHVQTHNQHTYSLSHICHPVLLFVYHTAFTHKIISFNIFFPFSSLMFLDSYMPKYMQFLWRCINVKLNKTEITERTLIIERFCQKNYHDCNSAAKGFLSIGDSYFVGSH